ncbi:MAG TPA: TraR/DksA family transcriptional regulator [Candidatus Tripitaka californicus]|uniref:TraR/DksA family transcriptional regulator n=1 Tax=Candidatus Tripitaka californicus TaxID=3367616 RepID=UPI0040259410
MDAKELASFKKTLLFLREKLVGNVNSLQGEALGKNRQDAAGDLSNVPFHMADLGTDNYERDIMIHLMENETEAVRNIDTALARIEKGIFGVCEVCWKKIPKARLAALPHAGLWLECQRKEESEAG